MVVRCLLLVAAGYNVKILYEKGGESMIRAMPYGHKPRTIEVDDKDFWEEVMLVEIEDIINRPKQKGMV